MLVRVASQTDEHIVMIKLDSNRIVTRKFTYRFLVFKPIFTIKTMQIIVCPSGGLLSLKSMN